MEFSAQQIAELLNGKVEGNPLVTVNTLSKIEEGTPGSICFLSNPLYADHLYSSNASIVIIDSSFELTNSIKNTCTLIRVEDARLAFTKLIEAYHQYKTNRSGIHKSAFIDETCELGADCYVGANVSIEGSSKIGNNCKIYPNATIGSNVTIGNNCVVKSGVIINDDSVIGNNCTFQSGAIIGSDGFGFAPNANNDYQKIIHLGNVIIEDNVEIGANSTIDKATLGSTIIRKGVKLDNLIQVAHNVEIGSSTVIAAQTGIAGSAVIGKNCMIGGQVGIIGHLSIADGVKIAAQSGIGQTIKEENSIVQGSPAYAIGDYKRSYVVYRRLPDLKNKIDKLEKELNTLKQVYNER